MTLVTKPGWSRYDHFASLCELLPVAVPRSTLSPLPTPSPLLVFSLVASLLVLSLGSLQLPVSRRLEQNSKLFFVAKSGPLFELFSGLLAVFPFIC